MGFGELLFLLCGLLAGPFGRVLLAPRAVPPPPRPVPRLRPWPTGQTIRAGPPLAA